MKIIAVDDNTATLENLSLAIKATLPVCRPECFLLPDDAIAYALKNKVDIAFLNIRTDETDGMELSKRLKEINNKTYIIYTAEYGEHSADILKLHTDGYMLKSVDATAVKAAIEHLNIASADNGKRLRVQAFGNFEVFAFGKPLKFARSKAKELFAYLIHKRGSGCTLKEIAATLFADREGFDSHPLLKQAQNIITAMMNALKECNAEDAIIKTFNNISVDITKLDCDYYNFLQGDSAAINSYMGEYMSNYDWAEFMVGYLDSKYK